MKNDLWNKMKKRSSTWTFGLCLTGVLVIGSIVVAERMQRSEEENLKNIAEQQITLEPEEENPAVGEEMYGELSEQTSLYGETAIEKEENLAAASNEIQEGPIAAWENQEETSMEENQEEENQEEETKAVPQETIVQAQEASSGNIISEEALQQAQVAFQEEDTLIWPCAGTIAIDYSMDGSVYFPTLNQYRCNPALVIGSETGNQVLAAAKGIVEKIETDEITGLTMTVNIGNGYRLVYGQIKEAAAAEGDLVETGTLLGYISEPTRYYTKEGSNLYFQMTKDGSPVDPVLYME